SPGGSISRLRAFSASGAGTGGHSGPAACGGPAGANFPTTGGGFAAVTGPEAADGGAVPAATATPGSDRAAGRPARGQRPVSISEPFIKRPVGTTLLTVGLTLAGLVAFRQLPISALPQVDYPTIVVSTTFPGASAQTMASSVTAPLERQFG